MYTVSKTVWSSSYQIKNSKFEIFLTQVNTEAEVKGFLVTYQDHKATHNCYAYLLGTNNIVRKFNDDHEPIHSAGYAILRLLDDKKLTNIIVLVRRYFHPPKLGANALARAYQYGLKLYLQQIKLLPLKPSKKYCLCFPSTLAHVVYQWQKLSQFEILVQTKNAQTIKMIINCSKDMKLIYHPEIEIVFLAESFLVSLE